MRSLISISALCASLLFSFAAHAGQDVSLVSGIEGPVFEAQTEDDAIVVVEERGGSFQIGDVMPDFHPGFQNIIPREAFENRITDVAEVISQNTPVQIRSEGGLGSFSSISLRGSSGARLPVYVDGTLLNDMATGSADLNSLSLNQIEQIEVYRGIVPMTFAQGSIGGAINIRTRRPAAPQMRLSYGTGSYGTHAVDLDISAQQGAWDYVLAGSHMQSENDYSYVFNNGTQYNTGDDYETERNHNAVSQNNLFLKLGNHLSSGSEIQFSLKGNEQAKQLPTWFNTDASATLDSRTIDSSIKWLSDNNNLNKSITVGTRYLDQTYDDRASELGLSKQYVRYLTQRQFAHLLLMGAVRSHVVTTTTELAYDRFAPESLLGGNEFSTSERWSLNAGLQAKSFYFADRLIVSPGVRFYADRSHRNASTLLPAQSAQYDYVSSQLGLQLRATNELKLKTNLASYYRAPTFYELFGDRGTTKGNPELLSERGFNLDAGVSWQRALKTTYLDAVSFSATYYRSSINDVIVWMHNSQGVGFPDNIPESLVQGVELEAGIENHGIFKLQSSLNVEDATVGSDNSFFDDKRLPGRAAITATNQVTIATSATTSLKLQFNAVVGRYYDQANSLPIEDQYRLNSAFSWLLSHWRFDIELNNLLNQRQEDYYLKPLPGRSVFFTMRYNT